MSQNNIANTLRLPENFCSKIKLLVWINFSRQIHNITSECMGPILATFKRLID